MRKAWSLLVVVGMIFCFTNAALAEESYPYVIEPQFDYVRAFQDGMAVFRAGDTQGYVDKSGNLLIVSNDKSIESFSEGLAAQYTSNLTEDERCGYINKSGELVIDYKFSSCGEFQDGIAIAGIRTGEVTSWGTYIYLYGIIDRSGNYIVEPQFASIFEFVEGMAKVSNHEGKLGFINTKGEVVVPLKYDYYDIFYDYSEGLAVVGSNYVDKNGKVVLSFDRADLTPFRDGVAKVYTMQGQMLIDKSGKRITQHYYEEIGDFSEGLAMVVRNGKAGYIDRTGKEVIPPKYEWGFWFRNGTARVIVENSMFAPAVYALIDKQGNELARYDLSQYAYVDHPYEPDSDFIAVKNQDGKYGYINRAAEVVVPFDYTWAYTINDRLALVEKGDKMGIRDVYGNEIEPQYRYADIQFGYGEGLLAVRDYKTRLWGFIELPIDTMEKQKTDNPAVIMAKPTASKVTVNGEAIAFQAYNIQNNNYFKLRDIALVLNHTEKSFSVGWDGEKKAITLESNREYIPVGGELAVSDDQPSELEAQRSSATIYLDGKKVELTAYLINGNNYFKLRDLGAALDFGVIWDGATKTIGIDTSIGYSEES